MVWVMPTFPPWPFNAMMELSKSTAAGETGTVAGEQGLTLVHLSAQHEPFLLQHCTLNTHYYTLTPPEQPLSNPEMHPLSHRKRSP
jgi:hypothetical protein